MKMEEQSGESVVLIASEPHKLRYGPIVAGSLRLYSKAASSASAPLLYAEGADYIIDETSRTIRRTPASRIPDWSQHPMYGLTSFDHNDFADYSNRAYTLYSDYQYALPSVAIAAATGGMVFDKLPHTRRMFALGESITYVVFGDSISTGAEASGEAGKFYNLFADHLCMGYPEGKIEVCMKAVGGENSQAALARLQADVIGHKPDLVTIGYGMNDQNRQSNRGNAVPPESYKRNVAQMIEAIQQQTDADIILITPCLPNPLWIYASDNVASYAEALRELGTKYEVGVADVQRLWLEELSAGKTHESLLLNNVNHPNDYGHRLYAKAFIRQING